MLGLWRLLHVVPLRIRSLFMRDRVERELEEELQFYVEERSAQEIAGGQSAEAAREMAWRAMDGRDQVMEACRDARGVNLIENIVRDMRHGVRSWRRTPGVWALAVVALGLGIGTNSTIFCLIEVIFHRPLAGLDHARDVHLDAVNERRDQSGTSLEDFLAWRRSGEFELMVATRRVERVLSGAGKPERMAGQAVSPDFFRLLRAVPAVGRFPSEGEYHNGTNGVMVLSYGAWQNRFQGRGDVVGQTVLLDDARYTIIGVASKGFWFPDSGARFWMPMSLDSGPGSDAVRGYRVLARLREGAGQAGLEAALAPLSAELERRFPASHAGWGVRVRSLFEGYYGQDDGALIGLLSLISGGILLICCGNVANLLLARGVARQREMSVRAALGASRRRMFGQSLTEGLLLAIPGALLGLGAAQVSAGLTLRSFNFSIPIPESFIDQRVVAVNGLAALVSIFAFGLYPALMASRADAALESGAGRRATLGRASRRFSVVLVALEAAIGLALVITAMIGVRGMQIIFALSPGYDRTNVVRAEMEPSRQRYPAQGDYERFYERLLVDLKAGPIRAHGLMTSIPAGLGGDGEPSATTSLRRRLAPRERPVARYIAATGGAIEALRIPIVRGRRLEDADRGGAERVAMVNQALCDQLLAGLDPIGERIVVDRLGSEPFRIVGVYPNLLGVNIKTPPAPQLFVSYYQAPRRSAILIARADETTAAADSVRRVAGLIDPEEPVELSTLQADAESDSRNGLVFVRLVAILAGLALFLSGCGLFGLLSQTVTQRLPEIGIRVALGASEGSVRRMIVCSGLRLIGIGAVVGTAGGLLIGKVVASQMVNIRPTDGSVLGPACAMFLLVASAACVAPVRRAVRADVMAVLRQD